MLQGYIDSISPDKLSLSGWVQLGEKGEEPALRLESGTECAGVTHFGAERPDVRSARGVANVSFTLTLEDPVQPEQLISKAHQVTAEVNGAKSFIPLGGNAYHRMLADFVKAAAAVPGARKAVLDALDAKESTLATHLSEVRKTAEAGELSFLGFPVGLRSSDDIAQIGMDGHLFLTGGSNALRDQYPEPGTAGQEAKLEATASKWAAVISDNVRALGELEIPFLQVVIPEKLTALRHLAPLPIPGPTPLFRRLDELMADEPRYLSFLQLFENWTGELSAWQKNDTHCSPAGSLAMAKALLAALPGCDQQALDHVELSDIVYRNGDLAGKFFDIPLWDKQYVPGPEVFAGSEIKLVHSYSPGHFVGSHNIWANDAAPIKKKIVVFGNSFFGAVTSPTRLSWWFARLFSEYHLKWENNVDLDYVKDVRPDYVVSQTIERFLIRPPA